MTAVQRERREPGVPCITTLLGVSVCLCYVIPVKIPAEVNSESIFCMAIRTSLASQANAASLFRAEAAEAFTLQQTAPRKKGEDGGIFSLKLNSAAPENTE